MLSYNYLNKGAYAPFSLSEFFNMSLDLEFIGRAERVTSFNLSSSDFTSLKYKEEIQHLFNKHFFPKFDLSTTINGVDQNRLNTLIAKLRAESSEMLMKLHSYPLKGVGPGEATLFFLINNAHLGGGSSAGVDLFVGSDKYEVKAVKESQGYVTDFKVGGTVPLADIMVELNRLREVLRLGGSKNEMSGGIIDQMKQRDMRTFSMIEEEYANVTYNNYFKDHEIIFINNGSRAKIGNIEAIKKVMKKDITIERVTSNTIKPRVKL